MHKTIRLLTYNIHKGMNAGNRRFVLQAIRESLRQVDADIVMLQEIHGDHSGEHKFIHGWPDNNQLSFIAEEVWSHHAYGKNAVYQRGHHGNAVLSKYPVDVIENIDVSLMRHASRSLLHVSVDVPGSAATLHVICVHLGLFGFERDRQMRRLVSYIDESIPAEDALVIAGDFNDWRGKASRHIAEVEGMREVFESSAGKCARTFPALIPLLRMDRVYVKNCEIISGRQLRGEPWRYLSDHIPLLVELGV